MPQFRYTVGDLKRNLKEMEKLLNDDEPLMVVIDDGSEGLDELEEGSILEITEFGGFFQGSRTIRVKPR